MKVSLILLLLGSWAAFAQSLYEEETKNEMLTRTQDLITKIEACREDLKTKDVVAACSKIHEMFAIFPDHIKGIGVHMDQFESQNIKLYKETIGQLIFMHKKSLLCKQGQGSKHVDPTELSDELKGIQKRLERQKKIIKKSDTGYENSFYYEYNF